MQILWESIRVRWGLPLTATAGDDGLDEGGDGIPTEGLRVGNSGIREGTGW